MPGAWDSEELKKLKEMLKEMGAVLVAFSGGVDSTFLLKVAREVLGERVLAVTADSPLFSAREKREAAALARLLGARHLFLSFMPGEEFWENSPSRCYFCKRALFSALKAKAKEEGLVVVEGSNLDDLGDFRPGMQALAELGVRSPLKEAGLGKESIRELARLFKLPNWKKPANACLASRFPYGERITLPALGKVEEAEEFLFSLGLQGLRVRHHGELARLEIPPSSWACLLSADFCARVVAGLKELGYRYVTLDLEGYRPARP